MRGRAILFEHHIPKDILFLAEYFSQHGFELSLVGGAVRDSLIGLEVADFDLATSASPDEVQQLFTNQSEFALIPTGIAHGTYTLIYNKKHYEITSYRIDGEYTNKRSPDSVSFTSSLVEDLSRRDFTINAIAVNPFTKEIIDPFNGQQDIQDRIIRTVGEAHQRFEEDALRMLRACRFAAKLEYQVDTATLEAIKDLADNLQYISVERIREELLKMLQSNTPSIGIELMRTHGLLKYVLPELEEGYGVDQNQFHKYDVYTHNVKTCDHMVKDDIMGRWAALLHDVGKPRAKNFALKIGNGNVFYNHEIIGAKMCKHIMKRLKFSNDDIQKACLLVELHMFYYTNDWTDGAIRRFLKRFDGDINFLNLLFQLREADRCGSGTKKSAPYILYEFKQRIDKIMEQDAALKVSDLDINGNQLMQAFSLQPSPLIGKVLHHLLELVLDQPELNSYEQLYREAKLFLENHNS